MGKDKTKLLILNIKNTHQPNASWRIASKNFNQVKYIATEEDGKIKRVYTADGVKRYASGRCNFKNLRRVTPEIEKKFKNVDVSRVKGEANPCRYKTV